MSPDAKLTSVALRAHHLPAMEAFYAGAFGARFRDVRVGPLSCRFGALDGWTLKLVPLRDEADFVGFPVVQLGFEVEDIAAVVRLAEQHGGRREGAPRPVDDVIHGAVRDPDGNTIELRQRAGADRRAGLTPGSPAVRREVLVGAPAAAVWRSWTTSAGFEAFFGVRARIELRPGGAYEIYFMDDAPAGERGSEGCQVLSYLPERVLSFSWNAPPDFGELREQHTWVVVELEPEGEGTRVRVTHLGWGAGARWDELRAYFDRAWGVVLDALRSHHAR